MTLIYSKYITIILLLLTQINISSVNPSLPITRITEEITQSDINLGTLINKPGKNLNIRTMHPDSPAINSWPLQRYTDIFDESIPINTNLKRNPQPIGLSFTALTFNNARTLGIPPDTMGAVGPTQYIIATNNAFRSFNKTTGQPDGVLNVCPSSFFDFPNTSIFDTRIRYDQFSNRWFITAENGNFPNTIYIGMSNDSVITKNTIWTIFSFVQDQVNPVGDFGLFADYPTLGIDAHALYIGVNMFDMSGNLQNSTVFVIQKSSLLKGGPMVITAFRDLIVEVSPGVFDGPVAPQGTDNFDQNPTFGNFIGVSFQNLGELVMRRIINPGSTTPTISDNIYIIVPSTSFPLNAPHKGNLSGIGGLIDTGDDRLLMAHIRNNHLFTDHNIAVDNAGVGTPAGDRDGARWYELDVTAVNPNDPPTLIQAGTIFDSAVANPLFYYYPSIMTNTRGDLTVSSNISGTNAFINIITAGRVPSDPLGTLQTPTQLTFSSSAYNFFGGFPQRWGDYSYTSLDPNDNLTMWTIQEFCIAPNTSACQVAQLLAP